MFFVLSPCHTIKLPERLSVSLSFSISGSQRAAQTDQRSCRNTAAWQDTTVLGLRGKAKTATTVSPVFGWPLEPGLTSIHPWISFVISQWPGNQFCQGRFPAWKARLTIICCNCAQPLCFPKGEDDTRPPQNLPKPLLLLWGLSAEKNISLSISPLITTNHPQPVRATIFCWEGIIIPEKTRNEGTCGDVHFGTDGFAPLLAGLYSAPWCLAIFYCGTF